MSDRKRADILEEACAGGFIDRMLDEYIRSCESCEKAGDECDDGKKKKGKGKQKKFPNIASFCRYYGIGNGRYEKLSREYPEEFGLVRAALEDEALNSELSPTLIAAYLKRRLGYDGQTETESNTTGCGSLEVVFEHDILADGE